MSIKSFHILFIILSTCLSLGVGFWGVNRSPIISIGSFVGGVALVYYGIQVYKKFRTI
ncbi:MAG: hypothetical protein QGI18_07560 [Candidatus Marinimicrobia bacterium]|nr:hypothetical protein [Candidatus Neomarinimicrobiota bacterium]